jgi:hypothetical protein
MTLGFNSTLPCDSRRGTRSLTPHTPTCAPKFFSQKAQNAKPHAAFTCIFNQLPAAVSASRLFSHACNCGRAMCLTFTSLQKKTGGWGVDVLANSSERHGRQRGPAGGLMIGNHRLGSALHGAQAAQQNRENTEARTGSRAD